MSPPKKANKKQPKLFENGALVTQNGARIDKKWSQNRKKYAEPPKVATRWLPRPLFSQNSSKIFSKIGVSSGTPKSTKNRSLAPKVAPGSDCLSSFLANSVFLTCGLDCSSMFDEKSMKKRCIFQSCARFFNLAEP